jgi:hypothetical protein
MDEFEAVLVEIFKVRLPAMIDFFVNDSSIQLIAVSKVFALPPIHTLLISYFIVIS